MSKEQYYAILKAIISENKDLIRYNIKELNYTEWDINRILEDALKSGININCRFQNGNSLLHLAIQQQNTEMVELLLQNGANPNQLDEDGWRPIHKAAQYCRDTKILEILLKNECYFLAPSLNLWTCFHSAAFHGNHKFIEFIFNNVLYRTSGSMLINVPTEKGNTPLHFAAHDNFILVFRILLENGADVNIPDANGETCLDIAIQNKNYEIVKIILKNTDKCEISIEKFVKIIDEEVLEILLSKGFDIFKKNEFGWNCLHLAVDHGNTKLIEILLKQEGSLELLKETTEGCFTPASLAIIKKDIETLKLFIAHKIDLNYCERITGNSYLLLAVLTKNFELVKLLLENKVEINIVNKDGHSPLHFSAKHENEMKIPKILIEYGADIFAKTPYGFTVLHVAAFHSNHRFIKFFLSKINSESRIKLINEVSTEYNQTALSICVERNDKKSLEILLENGADVNIPDANGETCLDIAIQNKNYEIVKIILKNTDKCEISIEKFVKITDEEVLEILLSKGFDIFKKDEYGWNCLHLAVDHENTKLIEILLKQEGSLELLKETTEGGMTPASLAISKKDIETLKLFIAHKIDLNYCERITGNSYLLLAVLTENFELVKLLLENKVEINIVNKDGHSPLHFSAKHENEMKIPKILIEYGADIFAKTPDGFTVLHVAAIHANHGFIKFFLSKINSESRIKLINEVSTEYNQTALSLCVEQNDKKSLKILLENDADTQISDSYGHTPLHNAIRYQNLEIIEMLLEYKADPNASNVVTWNLEQIKSMFEEEFEHTNFSNTLTIGKQVIKELLETNNPDILKITNSAKNNCLQMAVGLNRIDIAKILLKYQANCNLIENGTTALHSAIINRNFEMVKLLLENNADPNIVDDEGLTPLHHVAKCLNNPKFIELLIKHGSNIFKKTPEGITALLIASSEGNSAILQSLIEASKRNKMEDILNDNQNEFEITPLFGAVIENHIESVEILLKYGADCNIVERDQETPLNIAIENKNEQIVILLLENGADLQKTNKEKWTCLHKAAKFCINDPKIPKILIKFGANVLAKCEKGLTPLHTAAMHANNPLIKILLNHPDAPTKFIDEITNVLNTPVILSTLQNHFETTKIFLENNADPNIRNQDGKTALFYAIQNKNFEITKLLLENGANPNTHDDDWRAPLHDVCGYCYDPNFAEILLTHNANPLDKLTFGSSPLHVAAAKNNHRTLRMILEHPKCKNLNLINEFDNFDQATPLQYAIYEKSLAAVKVLLEYQADCNIRNINGKTALHLAVENESFEILDLLLKVPVDPNIPDNEGSIALHKAVEINNFKMVQVLISHGSEVNAKNKFEATPISIARTSSSTEIREMFKERFEKEVITSGSLENNSVFNEQPNKLNEEIKKDINDNLVVQTNESVSNNNNNLEQEEKEEHSCIMCNICCCFK